MCFGLKTQSSFGRFGLPIIFLIWLLRAAPASADRLELGDQLDGWDCSRPDVMVSSADGLDLYVGGSVPNVDSCRGFAWFRRDPATGRLTLRKVWGQLELDSRSVGGLALSHDGRNLYVGASDDILTYARGPGGDLEKVGDEFCCLTADGVAVSPDDAEVWVLGFSVRIYSRSASGALTLKQSLGGQTKPAYAFIDANNAFVGQNLVHRQNGVWSYGRLLRETDINSAVVDARGDYLHVIGKVYDSTQLATYDLHSDSFNPVHRLTLGEGFGEFALGLARDPRTGDLYALSGVDEGGGRRAQVRRFTTSSGGQVSAAGAWVESFGPSRGLFLAISPDGHHLYTSFENESVALLGIHPSGLTYVPGGVDLAARLRLLGRAVPAGSGKFYLPVDREIQLARRNGSRYEIVDSFAFQNWPGIGNQARFDLALTPDLTLAAVVSVGTPNFRYRLALADLDPATGRITLREETSLELAADFSLPKLDFSHDGKFLYVVGSSLRIYRVERSPLRLELVGVTPGAAFGRLVISPDGRDAFIDGNYFLRDLATGLLTPAPSPFPDSEYGGKPVYIRDGRLLVVLANRNLGFQHLLVLERTESGWSLLADQALPGSRLYFELYADPQGRRFFLDVTQPEEPYQKGLQLWEWDAGPSPFRFAGEIERPLPNDGGIHVTWPFYSLSRDGNELYAAAGSYVNMLRVFRAKCEPGSAFSTCLGNGRFRAEIDWRDAAGAPHPASPARVGADDSRLFTFFDADNWEVLTKVLDGCAINQRFWVFSAATTDVGHSLRVTDTWSGQEVIYTNPAGTPAAAINDSRALDVCGIPNPGWIPVVDPLPPVMPAGQLLEVQNGRFEVSATWITASGQQGEAQALSARTTAAGLFYFFSPNNWEIQAKVLNGCAINNRIWFYAAATTDVGYTLKVRDRLTGRQKTYQNPVGQAAPAITDSNAFPCP